MNETDFQRLLAEIHSAGLIARQRELPAPLHSMHQRILDHFVAAGRAPTPRGLRAWAAELGVDVSDALNELVGLDLVQADVQAVRVLGAYPFASQPRGHRVDVDDGPSLEAYCAADALGVAAMLNRAVTIRSRDPQSGAEIRVEVRGDEVSWEPPEAVVSIPMDEAGDGRQSADRDCPAVNFHASPASARAHEQAHGLGLEILTVPQAHQLGSAAFGGLLEPDEPPGPATTSAAVDISFRPLERGDFPLLSEWFAKPHVEPWWRETDDLTSIEASYGPAIDGTDPTEVFIVERGGSAIGLIQRYLIDDNPGWARALAAAEVPRASVGIDYLIGDETLTGQGVGPHIIETFVEDIWRRYPSAPAITVAIRQENRRSWRAIEKSGFRRVWAGELDSDDPSDEGANYVYIRHRPAAANDRELISRTCCC